MSDIYTDPPQSRNEAIIKSTIDGTQYTDPPQSRMEDLLLELKEVIEGGGGGGTTVVANPEGEATDDLEKLQVGNDIYEIPKDYEDLDNKPSINSVELSGNKTASELGLQAELDGAQTVSGNPITVADAEAMNAESVKVELEPKQDLHGYDAPWVGGAGKNKLPLVLADIKAANTTGTWSGNVYSINNGTIEVLMDDANNVTGFKANGTFNAQTKLRLTTGSYVNNVFKDNLINGCIGGSENTYMLEILYSNDGTTYGTETYVRNGDASIKNNYDYIRVSLLIMSGYTSNNVIFYPMIRLATETDPTFAPYSNICPISGYSEVNVERVGKNWLNPATFSHTNPNTGETDNNWAYWTYTDCKPETIYSLDCNIELQSVYVSSITFYDKYYNNIDSDSMQFRNPNSITFTTPANTRYFVIVFYHYTSLASYDFTKAQVLEGSVVDEIIPYQGNTYTVSLGGTKYGGNLDVTNGVLTEDMSIFTDLTLFDWAFYEAGQNLPGRFAVDMSSILKDGGLLISDRYPFVSALTVSDDFVCYSGGGWLNIVDSRFGNDVSTFKASLSGASMVHELATSTTSSTTPTDIPLLENTNNVSTDGTNITLKYQPNNVIGECKVYTDEECAKVLPPLPTTDGTYHLSCEVTSGVGVLSWVSDS